MVINIAGKKYRTEAETIEDALAKFNLGWWQVKNKCIVKVSKGKKSHEHIFTARVLRRVFSNKTLRMIWGQRLTLLLK